MICPKCNSDEVSISREQAGARGSAGINWVRICLIICTCGLWLLIPKSTHYKTNIKMKTVAICHNCGNTWTTG